MTEKDKYLRNIPSINTMGIMVTVMLNYLISLHNKIDKLARKVMRFFAKYAIKEDTYVVLLYSICEEIEIVTSGNYEHCNKLLQYYEHLFKQSDIKTIKTSDNSTLFDFNDGSQKVVIAQIIRVQNHTHIPL